MALHLGMCYIPFLFKHIYSRKVGGFKEDTKWLTQQVIAVSVKNNFKTNSRNSDNEPSWAREKAAYSTWMDKRRSQNIWVCNAFFCHEPAMHTDCRQVSSSFFCASNFFIWKMEIRTPVYFTQSVGMRINHRNRYDCPWREILSALQVQSLVLR